MRRLALTLLLCALLAGCRGRTAPPVEHDAAASMAHAIEVTLYRPGQDGSLVKEEKRLPLEVDMAAYALSFLPQSVLTGAACRMEKGMAHLDVAGFSAHPDARSEALALASIVNTLLSLPGVEGVLLTFDGQSAAALPNGTAVGEPFTAFLVPSAAPSPTPAETP